MTADTYCRNCKHFIEIPMGVDPSLYACANPLTKKGPRPIGFVTLDALACALMENQFLESVAKPVIVMPPVPARDTQESDVLAVFEKKAVRVAMLGATLIGLASWLLSHFPASMIGHVKAILGW